MAINHHDRIKHIVHKELNVILGKKTAEDVVSKITNNLATGLKMKKI